MFKSSTKVFIFFSLISISWVLNVEGQYYCAIAVGNGPTQVNEINGTAKAHATGDNAKAEACTPIGSTADATATTSGGVGAIALAISKVDNATASGASATSTATGSGLGNATSIASVYSTAGPPIQTTTQTGTGPVIANANAITSATATCTAT